MLLVSEHRVVEEPPDDLTGREILRDAERPDACRVKGVMIAGRLKLLRDRFGPREVQDLLDGLPPDVRPHVVTPLSGSWVPFATIVALDRAIHERFHERCPSILALLGAASAAHGIGTVYRALDNQELVKFLEGFTHLTEQFQSYGRVTFTRTRGGGVMEYHDYPCFSPVFCASGSGFFLEAILRHGGRDVTVAETKCHCRGDSVCRYELGWK